MSPHSLPRGSVDERRHILTVPDQPMPAFRHSVRPISSVPPPAFEARCGGASFCHRIRRRLGSGGGMARAARQQRVLTRASRARTKASRHSPEWPASGDECGRCVRQLAPGRARHCGGPPLPAQLGRSGHARLRPGQSDQRYPRHAAPGPAAPRRTAEVLCAFLKRTGTFDPFRARPVARDEVHKGELARTYGGEGPMSVRSVDPSGSADSAWPPGTGSGSALPPTSSAWSG